VLSQKLDLITTQQASIHIQNSLPLLDAEPKHLEWLLSQIIGNALKFKDRSKPVQIEIRTYEKNEKTYVEVKDNGIGIQKIQQKKIFRIFQRLNKVDYKGTGIGLAMCKKIVEMYGGEIGLQSKEGVGTKVYFHLPSAVFS
ncbi:MAG: sensor histidine kinase, partial [Chitinophagales bacterium]